MEFVNKHQNRGIMISILFVVATFTASLFGIALNRFFWIGIFLFSLLLGIYYGIWKTVKTIQEDNAPRAKR